MKEVNYRLNIVPEPSIMMDAGDFERPVLGQRGEFLHIHYFSSRQNIKKSPY